MAEQDDWTTWDLVSEGDYVYSERDGKEWLVLAKQGNRFTITRDGRPPYSGGFSGPVRKVADLVSEREATTLLVENVGAMPICPVSFDEPGPILAHLFVFHGGWATANVESIVALTDLHRQSHTARPGNYIDHHHAAS